MMPARRKIGSSPQVPQTYRDAAKVLSNRNRAKKTFRICLVRVLSGKFALNPAAASPRCKAATIVVSKESLKFWGGKLVRDFTAVLFRRSIEGHAGPETHRDEAMSNGNVSGYNRRHAKCEYSQHRGQLLSLYGY